MCQLATLRSIAGYLRRRNTIAPMGALALKAPSQQRCGASFSYGRYSSSDVASTVTVRWTCLPKSYRSRNFLFPNTSR